jgi:predicted nucleotidyltransferase
MQSIQTDLDIITATIKSHAEPLFIYLFGSWAYGHPTADSDIDIYLVIPDADVDIIELGAVIRHALYKKLLKPLDLLIEKKSVFERRSRETTLESIIAQQGVVLYGK